MYDPHKRPDIIGEMTVMGKGRLVKARLPEQPAPNVSWFWIQLGNCWACEYFTPERCLNPKIAQKDFYTKYVVNNDCPEFEAGISIKMIDDAPPRNDILDVMKAVGLVHGTPTQQVDVIRDVPWSVDAAVTAHREQSEFLHIAHHADAIHRGEVTNDPSRGEYVDLSDDLERPVTARSAATIPPPPISP